MTRPDRPRISRLAGLMAACVALAFLHHTVAHADQAAAASTNDGHTSDFRNIVRYLWRDGVNKIAPPNRALSLPLVRSYSGPVLGAAAEGPLGFVPQHSYLSGGPDHNESMSHWGNSWGDERDVDRSHAFAGAGFDGTLHAAGLAKVFDAGSRFALDIGGGLYQQDSLTGRPELYGFELDAGARWSAFSDVDLYGRMAYREHYFDEEQAGHDLRQDEALEVTVGASYRLNAWQLNAAFRNMDVDSNVPGGEFERNRIETQRYAPMVGGSL